jgi:molybdenum cofactor synthesis domain-containing protein
MSIRVRVKALSKTHLGGLARHAAACVGVLLTERFEKEDPDVHIHELTLLRSEGGRKTEAATFPKPLTAAVIVLSDSRASGTQPDESGPLVQERLEIEGISVLETVVIPDNAIRFEGLLLRYADERMLDCIVSTGGTGLGPRDIVPDITRKLIDRDIPGVSQVIRAYGQERTPYSMLSRGVAGIRGQTLILNLPGSPAAVAESLEAVMPELLHVFKMLAGGGHP